MAKKRKPLPLPPSPDRRRFRQRLLTWYRRHGRDLPWRKTSDPYHILVSEIMLQQTQVDRVLPKYAEWLEKYPSLHALADAPEHDVTQTWRPLGYNIRPKRLQSIAREATIGEEHLVYINRLSDLLFTLARLANHRAGVADVPWVPHPR